MINVSIAGIGGQGSVLAARILAQAAEAKGWQVRSAETIGMAQRGGVVESTILLGGWKSPKLGFGEADIVLGFEPLETLRGLRYLKQGGVVFSSTDVIPPLSVSAGREKTRPEFRPGRLCDPSRLRSRCPGRSDIS